MLLTPRYDDPDLLRLDLPLPDVGPLLVGQRRRLADLLGVLDEEAWATQSRCAAWSVRGVISHLVSTNQFWAYTLRASGRGEPTRVLATFDPVATPLALVDAVAEQSSAEVLAAFVESNDDLADAVTGLDGGAWASLGEAPPGHVPLRAVALHALWDAWVHERDVALPLGRSPLEDEEEVAACLAYAAALGPMFLATGGSERAGAICIDATEPEVQLVVEVGASVVVRDGAAPHDALVLGGPAVALLEALSFRAPLPCPVPDDAAWLLSGLAEVFDQA
jgi:uncharacterized protein (TIGR03083 family)